MSAVSPDEGEEHGPAMRALDFRERAFALAYLDFGQDASAASRRAGYSPDGTDEYHRVQGHRVLHRDRVIAALHEVSVKRMKVHGYAMVEVVAKVALNPKSTDKDRLKAAGMILDRSGFHGVSEHKVTVEDNRTRAELLRDFAAALRDSGADLAALLRPAPLIDVTPERVEEPGVG